MRLALPRPSLLSTHVHLVSAFLLSLLLPSWLLLLLPCVFVAQTLTGREVCCYSISCKQQNNIDITLEWLTKHAKS